MSTAHVHAATTCGLAEWDSTWFGAPAATNADRWAQLAIPKGLMVDGVPFSALSRHPVWLPADACGLHNLQRYILTAARVMNKHAQQTNSDVTESMLEMLSLAQAEHMEQAKLEWLQNNWQTASARLLTKWLVTDGLGVVYINRCYTHSGVEFEEDEEDGFALLKHLPAETITFYDGQQQCFSHLPQCFVELLRMLRTSDIQWRFENEVLHDNNLPRDLHVKLNGFQLQQQESSSDLGFWTEGVSSLLRRTDDFNLSNSDMDKHDRKVMEAYMRWKMEKGSNDGHKLADTLQANGNQQFACVVNGVNEQLDAVLGLSPQDAAIWLQDAAMGELQAVLFAAKDAELQLRNAEMVMEAAEMLNIVDGLRDTLGVEKRSRIFEFTEELDTYDFLHFIRSGKRTTYENSFLYNLPLEQLCVNKFVLAAIQVIITDFADIASEH